MANRLVYKNSVTDRKATNLAKAKLKGFLKKLKSYEFLCKALYFLYILSTSGPVSLVSEGDGLMPYEIEYVTSQTKRGHKVANF